ncbi:MAG TPA: hypothetical protein VGJ93_04515 [Desulfuromonadaceae bacterium]|jgi:hypothetical protein
MKGKLTAIVAIVLAMSVAAQADDKKERRLRLNMDLGVPVQTKPPQTPSPPPPPAPVPDVPQVKLFAAPRFIYTPVLEFYVSTGIPYDIAYVGRDYYIFWHGGWFKSSFYNGPWTAVTPQMLPRALVKYNYDQVKFYRNKEFKKYSQERERYRGKWHDPPLR